MCVAALSSSGFSIDVSRGHLWLDLWSPAYLQSAQPVFICGGYRKWSMLSSFLPPTVAFQDAISERGHVSKGQVALSPEMEGTQLRAPCSPGCLSLQKASLQALALDSQRWLSSSSLRAFASGLGLGFCTTLNQVQLFKRKPSLLVVGRRLISLDLARTLSS